MKNFDLLPLDDIQMSRVKKFAEMHQRFGGIVIDVIDVNKISMQALIRVSDRKNQLSPQQLVDKVNSVFEGEVPENLKIYYTLMDDDLSKYYLTWDGKYVVRVHKYFYVWEIKHGPQGIELESAIPVVYMNHITELAKTAIVKAQKWLKNYSITNGVKL
jgi:hypothetical protein